MCNYFHMMLCELTQFLCNGLSCTTAETGTCHLVSLHLTQRVTKNVTGGKISAERVNQWALAPAGKDI